MRRSGWGAVVGYAIALQWAVILVLAAAAWIWGSAHSVTSVLAGGAAVAVPNTLLALWLTIRVHRVGSLSATALLLGEFLKLGLTLALLVLFIVQLKPAVAWIALIVGVLGALKAQWLALWFTRDM